MLQIAVLGVLDVRCDGAPVTLAGARLRALVARLALGAGQPVTASALVEAVWPDERPADEVNALQSLVSRLRRALDGAAVVEPVAGGYRLDVAADDVDALRFRRLADGGRSLVQAADASGASEMLREALGLWRGAVAVEVEPPLAVALEERRLEAVGDRIEADLALGRHTELVAELEALYAAHPLRERLAGQLMTALAGAGRQADALAVYDAVRARLADELGVDPSAELQERHLAVLRGTVAPAVPQPRVRTNVRAMLTSFVGREDDLARVTSALGNARLVTILGPGGAGKTRLAIESAARLRDAPDGVWFVELAPVTDPAEVAHAVLASLGLHEIEVLDRRTPRPPREALPRLLDALTDRGCVLVFDNCEHLLDAAAELADTLLARCPGLRVLATSREPLAIVGEALVPLSSLPTPRAEATLDEVGASPAIRLFVDRAAAVRPGFTVDESTVGPVTEIVRRLDGLPLAIELAAARLRSLPVGEIAARLSDRFRLLTGGSRTAMPRHRTLRAVVDWSWDLLTPQERLLAERIAVFPAGVTSESAAGVCADDRVPADVVPELLDALVDKSLLQLAGDGEVRYRMLETIREYGVDRLAERGEVSAARRTHAEYFASLVRRADPKLRTREQREWLRILGVEHGNVLAAMRSWCDAGDAQRAVAMALNLSWFWTITGRHAEATTWFGIVLDVGGDVDASMRHIAEAVHAMNRIAALEFSPVTEPPDAADPRSQIAGVAEKLIALDDRAQPMLAVLKPVLLYFSGDTERTLKLLEDAVVHDDRWVRAVARAIRARFAENMGDIARTRSDALESLAAFEEIGDAWGLASMLPLVAQLHVYAGELPQALACLDRARRLQSELGAAAADDSFMIGLQLSDVRMRLGDLAGARAALAGILRLTEDRAGPEMTALALACAGSLERMAGDLEAAREFQRRAEARIGIHPAVGMTRDHGIAVVTAIGAALELASGDVDAAAARLPVAYAAAVRSRDRPILALVAGVVARFAFTTGNPAEAARLLGSAARLRGCDDPTGIDIARLRAEVVEVLGREGFERCWQTGWKCDIDQAAESVDPAHLVDDAAVAQARLR